METPAASQVAQFYSGKTVFLTGATGFMGKVNKGQVMRKIQVRCSHRPSLHIDLFCQGAAGETVAKHKCC